MFDHALNWLRARRKSLRKFGLVVAILIFSVGFVIALRATPEGLLDVRPEILVPYAIFLPPFTYLLQSIELILTARAVDVRMPRKQAAEIVLYANAATYLPIPGGLLTRTAALRAKGVSMGRSASTVVLFTGLAGTVSFAYAGFWTLAREPLVAIAGLLVAGFGTVACTILARKTRVRASIVGWEVLLRAATTVYEAACLSIVFAAIGTSIHFSQAALLIVSGFIAMVLTIFPSGIGIREGIVALLSPLVGIDPATGFLAAATARIIALGWMALLAGSIMFWRSED